MKFKDLLKVVMKNQSLIVSSRSEGNVGIADENIYKNWLDRKVLSVSAYVDDLDIEVE